MNWMGFDCFRYCGACVVRSFSGVFFTSLVLMILILGNRVDAQKISGGEEHSLCIAGDGTVWAWGYNGLGELGDGTTTSTAAPVQVAGLSNVVAISSRRNHNFALKSDGTVWAWGDNSSGQLGDGTTTNRLTPVPVPNLTNIKCISAGSEHAMALARDGTVYTWGNNDEGQLGNNTNVSSLTPQLTPILTGVKAISAGEFHCMALLEADGSVWTWGSGAAGQLGLGNKNPALIPMRVGTFTNVSKIASGDYHSFVRNGNIPKVELDDPVKAHYDMLTKYTDADIHNLTAYLVTLK